jgi:hypothetical protein
MFFHLFLVFDLIALEVVDLLFVSLMSQIRVLFQLLLVRAQLKNNGVRYCKNLSEEIRDCSRGRFEGFKDTIYNSYVSPFITKIAIFWAIFKTGQKGK